MDCPYCGNSKTRVTDNRRAPDGVRRRRECLKCKKRFTTYEKVAKTDFYIIKKDGTREKFEVGKLEKGIEKAFEKRPVPQEDIEKMIAEIEEAKPLFLVFCNIPFSWLSKPDSPMHIFDWYGKYSQENYTVVGLVDIPDQGPSSMYWNADAQRNPANQNCVWIFKRKD